MRFTAFFAVATLLLSFFAVVWIGLDGWILAVWGIAALGLAVLWLLGRALASEFGIRPNPAQKLPWVAGAVGAFISTTMAAGLVRAQAPLPTFWLLGLVMVMAVTSLRLAYHRPKSRPGRA